MEQEATRDNAEATHDTADERQPPDAEARVEDLDQSGWVTTGVAAAALKRSPRRVREYIRRGKLAAKTEGEGVRKRWLVSIDSLNALLDEVARDREARSGSVWRPRNGRGELRTEDIAAADPDELLATVQELQYRLGRAEAHAELTERAESTLREERERLLADLARERERAERLEEELRRASRGWLRRFFGF